MYIHHKTPVRQARNSHAQKTPRVPSLVSPSGLVTDVMSKETVEDAQTLGDTKLKHQVTIAIAGGLHNVVLKLHEDNQVAVVTQHGC